jgi:hypothetical protein
VRLPEWLEAAYPTVYLLRMPSPVSHGCILPNGRMTMARPHGWRAASLSNASKEASVLG